MTGEDLLAYYAQRAHQYEQIYEKPERQTDLDQLRSRLRDLLAGHRILEIACGTGYWTEVIAPVAAAITATDANPEVLAVARLKQYPPGRVQFEEADAYQLEPVKGEFTACLAAFWWSHVPGRRQAAFLRGLHRRLGVGSLVVLIDNRLVEGSSTPISRRDVEGNTYQQRRLTSGSLHEVLKNFPSRGELEAAFTSLADEFSVVEFTYYWLARYRVAATS